MARHPNDHGTTHPRARAGPAELTALVDAVATHAVDAAAGVHVVGGSVGSGVGAREGAERWATAAAAPLAALQRAMVDAPPRPALVRVWWAGLSDEARAALGVHAPLAVGNLDGVPWPARVAANHRTLATYAAGRTSASGAVVARAPGPCGQHAGGSRRATVPAGARVAGQSAGAARWMDAGARVARVSGRAARWFDAGRAARTVARATLLTERLHALGSGPGLVERGGAPRFLLAFDPEREAVVEYVGHAIADTDDPFASPLATGVRAVALFVPGNESDLLQFEAKAHTMSELVHAAAPGTTGLVVWQGGRFPRGPQGLSSAAAVRLGRRFGAFVNAIPRDPDARYVAYGFSFGGGVVGSALRLGMRVDAVVHVASAGLGPGVRSLDDYPETARVPHVALLAPGDVRVAPYLGVDLPRGPRGLGHGADPSVAGGVTRLETGFVHHVPPGGDVATGRAAGILRGHVTLLERWGTTAKHGMRAALTGGTVELAAPRTRLERLGERLGLPWSPLQRSTYEPQFTTLPGPGAS